MESVVENLLDDIGSLGLSWLLLAAFLLAFGETAFLTDLVVPGEVGLVVVARPLLVVTTRSPRSSPRPRWARLSATRSGGCSDDTPPPHSSAPSWDDGYGPVSGSRRRSRRQGRTSSAAAVPRSSWAASWEPSEPWCRWWRGMSGMPYPRFLGWNVLASVAWTGLVVSAGYFFGRHADRLVTGVGLLMALTAGSVALLWWLVRRFRLGRGSCRTGAGFPHDRPPT